MQKISTVFGATRVTPCNASKSERVKTVDSATVSCNAPFFTILDPLKKMQYPKTICKTENCNSIYAFWGFYIKHGPVNGIQIVTRGTR